MARSTGRVFDKYIAQPHSCPVVNTKLLLLCNGIDVDSGSLMREFPDVQRRFKTSKSVVSYRHLDPATQHKGVMIDELLLSFDGRTSIVKTYITCQSPIRLMAARGRLSLAVKDSGQQLPVEVSLVELDEFSRPDPSFPEKNLFLNRIGLDRIGLLPFDGCELWLQRKQCAFCGSVPKPISHEGLPSVIEVSSRYAGDYRHWWEAHRSRVLTNVRRSFGVACQHPPFPHFHFMFMAENIADYDYLYEIAAEISAELNQVLSLNKIDAYFNAMPPLNAAGLELVKRLGYQTFMTNLEFIRHEDFRAFCPGKEEAYPHGYSHMIGLLEAAVGIFGRGNVRTNFVLTGEQIPHLREGLPELAEKGIVSDVTVFFPRKASKWKDKKSPSIDEVLSFSSFLASLYQEHGFHPYCCSLSSRSSILNEIVGSLRS